MNKKRKKADIISGKLLINKIAKACNYYPYQVEDVLYGLSVVLRDEIRDEREVKVKGVGTFKPKKPQHIKRVSNLTGHSIDKMSKKSCKFSPDVLLLNALNMSEEEWRVLMLEEDEINEFD